MAVSSIGLTTVTPTTGTPAQRPEAARPDLSNNIRSAEAQGQSGDSQRARTDNPSAQMLPASELKSAGLRGYGDFVDKSV